QRPRSGGRADLAALAVFLKTGLVHHGRTLRSARRGGVHQPDRASDEDAGAAGGAKGVKLWGGRFEGATDAGFEAFSGSFAVDRRLAAAEITGTRAHVQGLARAGVLSAAEADALRRALDQLAADL